MAKEPVNTVHVGQHLLGVEQDVVVLKGKWKISSTTSPPDIIQTTELLYTKFACMLKLK